MVQIIDGRRNAWPVSLRFGCAYGIVINQNLSQNKSIQVSDFWRISGSNVKEMASATKLAILRASKALGLFKLVELLAPARLTIICYHGASLRDEHLFRPKLFISQQVFRARMRFLAENGYHVIGLGEGIDRLSAGEVTPKTVVITIDDGWVGTHQVMAPILQEFNFSVTLYVSTYYLLKNMPVLNVAVDYILWTTLRVEIDPAEIDASFESSHVNLDDQRAKDRLCKSILSWLDRAGDATEKKRRLKTVCHVLDVDSDLFDSHRLFHFMNSSEATDIRTQGVSLQLHTHRHRFPTDSKSDAQTEIQENRKVLVQEVGCNERDLVHFCYPSGIYNRNQFEWLAESGIESATTTDAGVNTRATNLYELYRFLDADDLTDIEFEAEIRGFTPMLRAAFSWLRK